MNLLTSCFFSQSSKSKKITLLKQISNVEILDTGGSSHLYEKQDQVKKKTLDPFNLNHIELTIISGSSGEKALLFVTASQIKRF